MSSETLRDLSEHNQQLLLERGIFPDKLEDRNYALEAAKRFYRCSFTGGMLERLGIVEGQQEFPIKPLLNPDGRKAQLISNITRDSNLGVLVIRPEMVPYADAFVEFLNTHGYSVLHQADKKIGIREYEKLFETEIISNSEEEKIPYKATKLITTLDITSQVLFFARSAQDTQEAVSTADEFVQNLLGSAGVETADTLRGSMVYKEATKLAMACLEGSEATDALDPFHIYDDVGKLVELVGTGVYSPNEQELPVYLDALCDMADLEAIEFSQRFPNILRYNQLWESGEVTTPLLFLIGGYAGTGKSTVVSNLLRHFSNVNAHVTGALRATIRNYEANNPFLNVHTYRLDEVDPTIPIEEAFMRQVEPIADLISGLAAFAATEKQHWLFDGNHVIAGRSKIPEGVIPIEIYLKVSDPEKHAEMIGGPTHNRKLTPHEFENARKLHDFIVNEAKKNGKKVVEYDEACEQALKYINDLLGQYLNERA